ncbi:hypothetical protein [Streptomyces sp. NPDC050485]|uniref:hypothetical protein n=1 Tax=Streptomyces sp. NPDC050485 TaxID=3365617 RepID=UPI00378D76D5
MTLKEKNVEKDRPLLSTVGLEPADGMMDLMHCSDLLAEFLATISRMQNEYLQAATEGWSAQGSYSE